MSGPVRCENCGVEIGGAMPPNCEGRTAHSFSFGPSPGVTERILSAADAVELLDSLDALVKAFEHHNPGGITRPQGEALRKARALVERARGRPSLPMIRCQNCGREWPRVEDDPRRVPLERCLGCGSTQIERERAPDGIDFRSQHTEKGRPS